MNLFLSALVLAIGALPFAIVYSFAIYSIMKWLIGLTTISWFRTFLTVWILQTIINGFLFPKHVNDYKEVIAIYGFILILGLGGWIKSLFGKKTSQLK
ncbi:hypothetical protein OQZ33_07060 [Pedobacter sp. MC2016-05]|uniref:hypothetical protein n=1 Tax=Pedobacter sp. MC2016-05 TaxID=2994474 RepID=UPI002246D185|nr:hypothetical protein [Pedobacter sp. MC2016-05]MCX2474084.1 hypothetical protein [Pedobacter sp. MC2016-05]